MGQIRKNKVFIYTCTCHRRDLDAKKVSKYLIANDYELTNDPKKADYIIFFACGFVNEVADQCLEIVKKLKKYNAELIVAGCLPEMEKEKLNAIFSGETLVAKNMEKIDEIFSDNKIKYSEIQDENIRWTNFNPLGISKQPLGLYKSVVDNSEIGQKINAILKKNLLKVLENKNALLHEILFPEFSDYHIIMTSRGCSANCSYCAIRKAIGTHKSKPLDICIDEFKKGLKAGYKKFVITADDLGAYGIDIGLKFPELIDKITKIEGDYGIEIQGLNPIWVVKYIDELEELIKRGKIKTLISPIQSGGSRILKLMNRFNDTDRMRDVFKRLKKAYPNLSLETNYLVGFPSETEDDVKKSLEFIKSVKFDVCYIFPFSLKTDTEAEKINPKIPRKIALKRIKFAEDFLNKNGVKVQIIK